MNTKVAIRRILGGLSLVSLTAALGSASPIMTAFWAEIFVPSGGSPSGPVAPLTDAALKAQAAISPLYSTTANGFTTTVILPKFDQTGPSPGQYYVLDSVQIMLGWAAQGVVNVQNGTTNNLNFTSAYSAVPLHIDGPAALGIDVEAKSNTVAGSATAGHYFSVPVPDQATCLGIGGMWNQPAPGMCQFTSFVVPQTTSVASGLKTGVAASPLLTTNLGQYQGFGYQTMSFDVIGDIGQYTGSSVPGLSFAGSANAGGVLEVVYTAHLASAPEPTTMALVGGALLFVGISRRKLKKA